MATKTWITLLGVVSLISGLSPEPSQSNNPTSKTAFTQAIHELNPSNSRPSLLVSSQQPPDRRSERGSGRDSLPG